MKTAPIVIATCSLAAACASSPTVLRSEELITINDHSFRVRIWEGQGAPSDRLVRIEHTAPRYTGAMAAKTSRARHMDISNLLFDIVDKDCPEGVRKSRNMEVSHDEKHADDPLNVHPSHVSWAYVCG